MVNRKSTKEMLPDEYWHYVSRYSAIRSGLSQYNLHVKPANQDELIALILRSNMESLFDAMMDDLEGFEPDQRGRILDFYIEQCDREDFGSFSKGIDG